MLDKLTLIATSPLSEIESFLVWTFLYFGIGFSGSGIAISCSQISKIVQDRYSGSNFLRSSLVIGFGILCFAALMATLFLVRLAEQSNLPIPWVAPVALLVGGGLHFAVHYLLNKGALQ